MGSFTHLCCVLITVQVVMTNWIQGATTINPTLKRQQSTLPPVLEKIREEDFHNKERIVFTKILPSTSTLYLEHNNSKFYKFDFTSFLPSTILTTVEQTHYKTSSLVVEESIDHYYKQLSTSAPNNSRNGYEDNSNSNYYNLLISKNNEITHDNTFKTVSVANHIKMKMTSSICYNLTKPSIAVYLKTNLNHQHLPHNHFENIPTKHSNQFNLSLSEKYDSQQYSNSYKNYVEHVYLNLIKPTAVILEEFPVVSINYPSSKNFGSLSLSLESSSLAFNITFNTEFQENKPSSSLSSNEKKYSSTTKVELDQKTSENYKYLLNRNLKMFENETSDTKIDFNFFLESNVSSRAVKNSTKEVPVLKTKIVKSNSIVLTNIRLKEKRFCRLCKTATEPLKNQDDFKVKMTSDSEYFPEPKTKYYVKGGNIIETKIPKKSNASFIITPTVPPVSVLEPRTKMPTITQSTTSLPKSISKNKLLDFPTEYYTDNRVSIMISEISKTLSFQESETISSYELDDMEDRSNVLGISLYSSFRSSSEFPILHKKTAYLNLY